MTDKINNTEDFIKVLSKVFQPLNKEDRIDIIKKMFVSYGFLQCPINDRYLKAFISMGFTNDKIYDIGCDIANGFGEITSLTDEEIKKMGKYL